MRHFILLGFLFLSFQSHSQSFMILKSGVTLTTDKSGNVYDSNKFFLSSKVSFVGGQFFVDDKLLVTVDSEGVLSKKTNKIKDIKGKGLNYFVSGNNRFFAISSAGYVFENKEDRKIFKDIKFFGGNFFLVQEDKDEKNYDLYTVNDKGNYFQMRVPGLNPADITAIGGTYFQTFRGLMYTVSKDGLIFANKNFKNGSLKISGGNFFIYTNNTVYTVAEDGTLIVPILPADFAAYKIKHAGANYMIDTDGRLFTVDNLGQIFERFVKEDLKEIGVVSKQVWSQQN